MVGRVGVVVVHDDLEVVVSLAVHGFCGMVHLAHPTLPDAGVFKRQA